MSDSLRPDCPFCQLAAERVVLQNAAAVAVADAFPVAHGHSLIIARRHVADFFELDFAETEAIMELLRRMRDRLVAEFRPDGFNIGINVGIAAGQTVMHAHMHLIPRYSGDLPDPTGGIRNVIPGKGAYA